jgi:hypothetical protein
METTKQTTRTIRFHSNGSGHNRKDERLSAKMPCHFLNYGSYILAPILENMQERDGVCPCSAF